ncbi:hypothetical protein Pmani_033415 [Petrolisthes manimaculis]|uniref:Uncharacterized protein n=1 Tax=Petrolisthes manimaculis TaxID=1843537 RepID=A0AAE1NRW4_9EUCA|nr:hypothetical protein Pmani_033415 [Petrolisthes manimaculis]
MARGGKPCPHSNTHHPSIHPSKPPINSTFIPTTPFLPPPSLSIQATTQLNPHPHNSLSSSSITIYPSIQATNQLNPHPHNSLSFSSITIHPSILRFNSTLIPTTPFLPPPSLSILPSKPPLNSTLIPTTPSLPPPSLSILPSKPPLNSTLIPTTPFLPLPSLSIQATTQLSPHSNTHHPSFLLSIHPSQDLNHPSSPKLPLYLLPSKPRLNPKSSLLPLSSSIQATTQLSPHPHNSLSSSSILSSIPLHNSTPPLPLYLTISTFPLIPTTPTSITTIPTSSLPPLPFTPRFPHFLESPRLPLSQLSSPFTSHLHIFLDSYNSFLHTFLGIFARPPFLHSVSIYYSLPSHFLLPLLFHNSLPYLSFAPTPSLHLFSYTSTSP